jgi:hypothetical protein
MCAVVIIITEIIKLEWLAILINSMCILYRNLSALKWLQVHSSSSSYNPFFLTDSVFLMVFSLMQLEYLDFNVENANVKYRVQFDHYWSLMILE